MREDATGQVLQHSLVEWCQSGGNGTLLDHEAVKRVLLVTAVDDTRDAWPDRAIWRWVWPPHRVDILIGVVSDVD